MKIRAHSERHRNVTAGILEVQRCLDKIVFPLALVQGPFIINTIKRSPIISK